MKKDQKPIPEPVQEVLEETKPSRMQERKERQRPSKDDRLDRQWS